MAARVLIVTGDPIGAKLAGPAIRAWNMADALAVDHEVTLVSLTRADPVAAPFSIAHVRPGDDKAFAPLEAWAEVIVFQGHAMSVFDSLRVSRKILVVDIYDPMHLEQLEQGRELPFDQWSRRVAEATEVLNDQLERGDFFLCASERQRMFWLGQLAALGRLNPATYRDDPDFDGLVSVVPFGLSSTPPEHSRAVVKGVLPGVGQHDKLVIWSGGLYNWFDPLTLIRAVSQLASTHPDLRLFFQGTKHPHPGVPEMEIVARSRALAEELGVLDRVVFFNESWVDYDDRQNYLLEADAGASTHFTHIETTFSFRTRILDYLWAGLPMVVTGGDVFAELIRDEELGVVVAPGDVDALARALEVVVYDTARASVIRENIDRVRLDFVWEKSLAPLMAFIADPHHAGDFLTRRRTRGRRRTGFRHDLGRVFSHLREEGPSAVVSRVAARVRGR